MLIQGAGGGSISSTRKEATQSARIQERNREGGTGKRVLQGVGKADEKNENEATDRLERTSSACDKCTGPCSRSDDDEGEGKVCCQCMGREENCTGIQESKMC